MQKKSIIFAIILLFLSACAVSSPETIPSKGMPQAGTLPTTSSSEMLANEAYPAGSEEEYPSPGVGIATEGSSEDYFVFPTVTAFQELPVAEQEAKKWKPNASLVQIPRLRQMETNIGLPKGPNGWFYTFVDTNSGSSVELYIEVIDGKMAGKTEVQQLFKGGNPPYKLLPIDSSKKLLDSNEAFQIFLDNMGNDYVKGRGQVEIDLQLVYLEGTQNPIWSIFDTADLSSPPLISIDAVTGELVNDPFADFR